MVLSFDGLWGRFWDLVRMWVWGTRMDRFSDKWVMEWVGLLAYGFSMGHFFIWVIYHGLVLDLDQRLDFGYGSGKAMGTCFSAGGSPLL